MKKNSNLIKAKKEANNEFYTQLTDIEKELQHYKNNFKDKIVYCNCDDYRWSNFYKYFALNFEFLGLKKLIATHFSSDGIAYKVEKTISGEVVTPLTQNGDFRSDECVQILKECDVVVTNPPFSLFREYVELMVKYDKKYLIIGNMNAITYKETFKLIKENKLWCGVTSPKDFIQPDNTIKKFGNVCWFTNLSHNKRNEQLFLHKEYNESEYPKYDNYDAIEVSKTIEIPMVFSGCIGVPISFLHKYNPNQFEILCCSAYSSKDCYGCGSLYLNNRKLYARIIIKHKQSNEN